MNMLVDDYSLFSALLAYNVLFLQYIGIQMALKLKLALYLVQSVDLLVS